MTQKNISKPIIYREGDYKESDLRKLRKNNKIWKEKNVYLSQLHELFEIMHPSLKASSDFGRKRDIFVNKKTKKENCAGSWVYFPWSGVLLHTVSEEDLYLLRTNRNKNLITIEEQEKISQTVLGFAGISVGMGSALNCVYNGIGRTIKLADYDILKATNLNRMQGRIDEIGDLKIELASRRIYEINPYADICMYEKGVTKDTLHTFFENPIPNIIFEAIDDFPMKITLRINARDRGVPLIMCTNLGDSVLVDIERYDLDKKTLLFNGAVNENILYKIQKGHISKEDEKKYSIALVGKENVPKRAIHSLSEIDVTLTGRPQLMGTISISGGIAAYIARKILLDEHTKSGRFRLLFDNVM
jgi:hypothetical protein